MEMRVWLVGVLARHRVSHCSADKAGSAFPRRIFWEARTTSSVPSRLAAGPTSRGGNAVGSQRDSWSRDKAAATTAREATRARGHSTARRRAVRTSREIRPGDLPRESRMHHYLSIAALTLALVALVCTAPAEEQKAPSPSGGVGGLGGLGGGDFTETLRNFGGQAQKVAEDIPENFKNAAGQFQTWAQGAGDTVSKTATDVFGRFSGFFNPSANKNKKTSDDADA
ncbi:secreted protein, putative [Ixodes scapularis]|uniref:Secreted protein, putative n=1 Tax=Ixodes scapularis TaxID=6945 RepID=B7PEZ9_IXOSC|nr:secreted protein, putative [Ixodes scapularis]|eukprot:XP_002433771.1 secreted protein, putative [Ixodes scapularis]